MFTTILAVHAAATWAMVGLIWFVQVVHYPLFAQVGESAFTAYHGEHTRRTTWVVAGPMLIEAATGLYLVAMPDARLGAWPWIGAVLLAVVWASTALGQVPRHHELARGFDPTAWRRLVRSNGLRTAAWSARGAVVLVMWLQVGG